MLRAAIRQCPETMWDDPRPENKFWRIAYHAIFYTHLYIQPTVELFKPWEKHRAGYESLGPLPQLREDETVTAPSCYTRNETLAYLEYCQQQILNLLPQLNLESDQSGFHWLTFGKLELQLYTIRHLQQHTGELCERLGAAGIHINWVGSVKG